MNKKLQTVFRSKYFYLVISVGVAIALWIVALNTLNPVIENKIEVAITYLNENAPAEKNLSRTSDLGVVMATIRVSGRQDTVNNLLTSEIHVEVDFADVDKPGMARLKVKSPTCERLGVKIEDYYPKEIEVSYDTKTEMYLDVRTVYTDSLLSEGYEFISVVAEPDSVPISGFASEIEDLDYIKVSLSDNIQNGSIDSNKTISLLGRYITTGGQDVTANFSTEKVTVKINVAKRVPIKYSVVGEVGDDCYIVKDYISQDTILLQGHADALSKVSSIDLGEVSVAGATSSVTKKINIVDYIPADVTVYGDQSRALTVEIEKYETKKLEYDLSVVSQPGRNDNLYEYTIDLDESAYSSDGKAYITVKGKSADLKDLTVSTLAPKIDLKDVVEGTYPLQQITFTVPENIELIGEYLVNIKIVQAPQETETPVASTTPEQSPEATPTETVTPTPVATEEIVDEEI